jgi:hypothetical protein
LECARRGERFRARRIAEDIARRVIPVENEFRDADLYDSRHIRPAGLREFISARKISRSLTALH